MDIRERPRFWESDQFDLWLSILIGLLTVISLSHIPSGIVAALVVNMLLKYAARNEREAMIRLPVQAL